MSAVVQPDTGELTVLLTREEALAATKAIKDCMGSLCHLVKEAHDKQAWRALGYGSWSAYCKAEFDHSRSYSYRLIGHVNKILELSAAAGIEAEVSPMGDTIPERVSRDLDMEEAVEAVEEAVFDLPDDATDEDKADAATEGIARMRARKALEADKTPAPDPVKCNAGFDCNAMASGPDGMCNWHRRQATKTADQTIPPTSGAADRGSSAAAPGPTSDQPTAPGGQPATPTPDAVTLPDDWQTVIGHCLYVTRLDPDALRAVWTDDDRADLTAAQHHLNLILQENP